jgi:site-specific recombinase XerD
MSPDAASFSSHITTQTPLLPAIRAWESYLLDQDRSIYTVKAFVGDVQLLVNYLPPDRFIGSITTNDLNHFIQWLQSGRGIPCSPKSLSRRITSIKSFFRWLATYSVISADPAEKVLQQTVISPLPVVLSKEEEFAVLETATAYRHARKPDARPYTLLLLLLSTGVKKGECLTINVNHIDTETSMGPVLFVRYANPRYRSKERKITLPETWKESYQEYLAHYQPDTLLFPWSPRRLEYLLEEIGEKAGLSTKHLSFDMCRWTCALNDLHSGMELDKIRQKLGISKIQWREISMKLRRLAGDSSDKLTPVLDKGEEPAGC